MDSPFRSPRRIESAMTTIRAYSGPWNDEPVEEAAALATSPPSLGPQRAPPRGPPVLRSYRFLFPFLRLSRPPPTCQVLLQPYQYHIRRASFFI